MKMYSHRTASSQNDWLALCIFIECIVFYIFFVLLFHWCRCIVFFLCTTIHIRKQNDNILVEEKKCENPSLCTIWMECLFFNFERACSLDFILYIIIFLPSFFIPQFLCLFKHTVSETCTHRTANTIRFYQFRFCVNCESTGIKIVGFCQCFPLASI